jgi:hypothetical protein
MVNIAKLYRDLETTEEFSGNFIFLYFMLKLITNSFYLLMFVLQTLYVLDPIILQALFSTNPILKE